MISLRYSRVETMVIGGRRSAYIDHHKRGLKAAILVAAALVATGSLTKAHAQLIDRYFPSNVPAYQDWAAAAASAASQQDIGYQPIGLRVGEFILHPSLDEAFLYDSDPFGSSAAGGSAGFETNAAITADSDWSRNGLNAALNVNNIEYLSFGRPITSWSATVGGLVNYADDEIRLGYSHINAVSSPTDVGVIGQLQTITSQVDDLRVSDTIGTGRVVLVPALVGQIYQFSDPFTNGVSGAQGLYNRDAVTGSLTASYSFAGGHNLVAILSDSQVAYVSGSSSTRPANYNDVSILGGIEYRQSDLLVYRALVGYEQRQATGHGLVGGTISAPAAELDIVWTPTVLTSVVAKVSQSFENAPTGFAQALTESTAELELTYAFRRNVTFRGSMQIIRATFAEGGGSQTNISPQLEAQWALSRHMSLSLRYDYTQASSIARTMAGFTRNQVFLRAGFHW